jgi:hypothetical protein
MSRLWKPSESTDSFLVGPRPIGCLFKREARSEKCSRDFSLCSLWRGGSETKVSATSAGGLELVIEDDWAAPVPLFFLLFLFHSVLPRIESIKKKRQLAEVGKLSR